MLLPLVVVGFAVGFVAASIVVAIRAKRTDTIAVFRSAPAGAPTGAPYRAEVAAPATPTLEALLGAARTAKLDPRATPTGFAIARGKDAVALRVPDPTRVPIASIELVDSGHETLVFELALALVPIYGPIHVTEAMWGTYLVDGRKSHTALHEERGERIRAMARGIQERLAASRPAWDQLHDKLGGSK